MYLSWRSVGIFGSTVLMKRVQTFFALPLHRKYVVPIGDKNVVVSVIFAANLRRLFVQISVLRKWWTGAQPIWHGMSFSFQSLMCATFSTDIVLWWSEPLQTNFWAAPETKPSSLARLNRKMSQFKSIKRLAIISSCSLPPKKIPG